MTLVQLLDFLTRGGLLGLLVMILYGSYRGIWVWGSVYRKLEAENRELKELMFSSINVADAVTEYAVQQRMAQEAAKATADRRRRLAEEATEPSPAARARRRP